MFHEATFNMMKLRLRECLPPAFHDALIMEERFLKQKAKIEWLKEGDSNSAYFHKAVKSRVSRSRIDAVTDANGVVFQNEKVADAFISHYEVFLRQPGITNDIDTNNLFQTRLTVDDVLNMVRVISDQEAWDTVGSDVNYVVREFFVNGRLLKEINHTIIALILKVKAPARGFGFHDRMVAWIMECVATSFSISINGSLHGHFKGKRGLRQGDPLSPYLFTLVMEVLMLMLQRRVRDSNQFTYHRYCSKLDLINLCFADDLFLFAHGDVNSVMVIKEALDEFKCASSLIPSLPKSTTYFCNVLNFTKLAVL
ncbi:reverse transcriptase domain, reverse transcriptase zinc-binding domain protein [Tanacetum coccineum]